MHFTVCVINRLKREQTMCQTQNTAKCCVGIYIYITVSLRRIIMQFVHNFLSLPFMCNLYLKLQIDT